MKIIWKTLAVCLLSVVTMASMAAKDPADNEDTEEHPEITRFPGFYIDNSKRNDYNEVNFLTSKGEVAKAGKYWFVDYILKEGSRQPSALELIKNYENAAKKAGGSMVFREPPATAVYRMPRPNGGERWMQMSINNEGYRYQLEIVDIADMQQKVEFSADQMAEAINKDGFIALNGILFDTGKATIKAESEPLLNEVVAMLKRNNGLKISVEGHTDNVGDKKANLDLSKKRAESVVAHVTKAGIDAKRLKADGKGDTAPVADNRTEGGRAKNRRVELVKF